VQAVLEVGIRQRRRPLHGPQQTPSSSAARPVSLRPRHRQARWRSGRSSSGRHRSSRAVSSSRAAISERQIIELVLRQLLAVAIEGLPRPGELFEHTSTRAASDTTCGLRKAERTLSLNSLAQGQLGSAAAKAPHEPAVGIDAEKAAPGQDGHHDERRRARRATACHESVVASPRPDLPAGHAFQIPARTASYAVPHPSFQSTFSVRGDVVVANELRQGGASRTPEGALGISSPGRLDLCHPGRHPPPQPRPQPSRRRSPFRRGRIASAKTIRRTADPPSAETSATCPRGIRPLFERLIGGRLGAMS